MIVKNAQRALQVIRIMGAITLAFDMEGHEEVKAHFDWLQEFDQLIAGLLGRDRIMEEADIWAAARKLAEADGD